MKRHFIKKPVLASNGTGKVTKSQIVKLAQSMLNVTYDEANDVADLAWSYYCDPNNSSSERACIEDAAGYLGYSDVYASTEVGSNGVVKFEVGQTYTSSGLYGGQITYKVVSRTANTVSLAESHVSEDTWEDVDDGVEEYKIVMQDMYDDDYKNIIGKEESVVIWEYSGHQGYLFATDSTVGQDEDEYEDDYMDAYEEYEEASRRNDRTPSSTAGDYSPGHPWDAPGMSMRDFI